MIIVRFLKFGVISGGSKFLGLDYKKYRDIVTKLKPIINQNIYIMKKLKKIAKAWGVIALFMLVSSFVVENISHAFYIAFASFYAISAIFILFGWDKYITYGDSGQAYANTKPSEEDTDDWQE